MKDKDFFEEVLTKAYKRMHRYSWAEASLQGLQTMWDLPLKGYSWATGGYMGAILSGQTTCGLLIGSSVAIGLRCGQGMDGVPEEHEGDRNSAIQAVGELYRDFLKEFDRTDLRHFPTVTSAILQISNNGARIRVGKVPAMYI